MKRLVYILSLLLICAPVMRAFAAGQNSDKAASKIEKVKRSVAKVGVGSKARATITLNDGSKVKGYVYSAGEEDFVMRDHKTDAPTTIKYAEVKSIKAGNNTYVNYVDALNMALPSFVRIGIMDKKDADVAAAQTLFTYAEKTAGTHGLFNVAKGLWWRDASFVGTNTYWSRGNGWAIAAMAKLLKVLPAGPFRTEVLNVFTKMAAAIAPLQRSDGFWNADLGPSTTFAGPETSGTAFFTYAMAYGISAGILPAATYKPVVEKAWQGMVTKAVHSNGLLGFVQGPGKQPSDHQPVKATDTAAYGVGGFLLAGSQLTAIES